MREPEQHRPDSSRASPALSETCIHRLRDVCRLASLSTGGSGVAIWQAGAEGPVLIAGHGVDPESLPQGSALLRRALAADVFIPDIGRDARFSGDAFAEHPLSATSFRSARLSGGQESGQAVLVAFGRAAGSLASPEAFDAAAGLARTLLEFDAALAKADNERVGDRESGLLTRNALAVYLSHALSRQERAPQNLSLLHLRLDRADEDLRDVAYRLHLALRACDLIARVGAADFAVALFDAVEGDIGAICGRIRAELRRDRPSRDFSMGALLLDGEFSDAWDLLDQARGLCEDASRLDGERLLFGRAT